MAVINNVYYDEDSMDICLDATTATDYDIECYRVDGFSEEQIHDIECAKKALALSPNIRSVDIDVDVDIINYEDDVEPNVSYIRINNVGIFFVCLLTDMATFQTEMFTSKLLCHEDYDKIVKQFRMKKYIAKV